MVRCGCRRIPARRGQAATATAGAPTSFQPDVQAPALAMLSVMLRNARPSSWRARRERPDVDRVEADRLDEGEDRGLGVCVVAGDEAVELDAAGDRVALVRGEQRVERLDDAGAREERGELLGVRGGGVDLRAVGAERHPVRGVHDDLAARRRRDLGRDLRGARERGGEDDDLGALGGGSRSRWRPGRPWLPRPIRRPPGRAR